MSAFAGQHLVVFGCGYVGGEVARQALARGLRVTALTRNPQKAASLRAEGVEVVLADLAETGWHATLRGADLALNAVSSGGGGVEGYRRSYLDGMKSVLAWMRTAGFAGPLVYTSSTSVYSQGGGDRVDESAPVAGRDERSAVLVETEALLRDVPRAFVLRLAGIYGPSRVHLVEQVRLGEVSGVGSHHLNLIHRDDICAAVWSVFGASASVTERIFNVADEGGATKEEVTAWLAGRLGVPPPRFTGAPAGGRPRITPDRIIVNQRLKSVLGWAPRFPTFREGYGSLLSR